MKKGDRLTVSRVVTEDDVNSFGRLSNDYNPLHFSDVFAAKTVYKKRIAHGLIGAGMISAGITELMGDGSIILEMNIRMKSPVYINDRLDLTLEVDEISKQRTVSIKVMLLNQDNKVVIEGSTACMRVY